MTLKMKVVTTKITGTLINEQPIAIYTIDKVLLPKELFKAQADTPASDVTADSPKLSTKKTKKAPSPSDEADTPSLANDAADQNAAVRFNGTRFGSLIVCVWWIVKTMLCLFFSNFLIYNLVFIEEQNK